ncbi:RDD family protein [Streptomyces sp. NPDC005573]|uniref:RDD family protein n=1 Tax=unclassified Streptomyces TaxID=2593676 RepID=UPI0033A9B46A
MSFGSPNNPYGQPQDPQQGYGYPQAPQAPQGIPPQQGYGYPQQGYGGYPQAGYGQPSYANWGQRFLGKLVDLLILGVPYGLALAGLRNDIPVLGAIGFLIVFGLAIWQMIMEGKTGQTLGKKAVGIRLVKELTGQPIGFGMAFVRQLAHFIDNVACYLGWLWPAWDAKRQTFADKVCGTIVIRSQ